MSTDHNPSADAVLLAILGFLVARGVCDPAPSTRTDVPDVLSPDGLAIAAQIVREANRVEAQMTALRHGTTLDDAVYRDYRRSIDELWVYVEACGLDALREEADRRQARVQTLRAQESRGQESRVQESRDPGAYAS